MATIVRFINVNGASAPFDSTLQAISVAGVVYPLSNNVSAGSANVVNDLTAAGLPAGTQFQIRLNSNAGASNVASAVLTYSAAVLAAANFVIGGAAAAPTITRV